MCDQFVVTLPADARSASRARRIVTDRCLAWGLGSICSDVTLPVSELVTNAFLHARTPATLTLSLTEAFVEVAVRDTDPRRPVLRPVRLDPLRDIELAAATFADLPEDLRDPRMHVGTAGSIAAGRGLRIVDAVADEWGTAELSTGKDVWFRVGTPGDWAPPQPCACPGSTRTTPGGLPVYVP